MWRAVVVATLVAACGRSFEYAASPYGTPTSAVKRREALDAPAVRHRRLSASWKDITVSGGGGLFSSSSAVPVATAPESAEPPDSSKIVIEVWLQIQVSNVGAVAAAVRKHVAAGGGRVVSESINGDGANASSADLELRVPPGRHGAVVDWIEGQGMVKTKRSLASDVGKILFDRDLALANLRLTMERLQELVKKDVPIKDLLEIEKEMTRVRGEIEKLDGEQRWLLDRVEYASIDLTIVREGGESDFAASARFRTGPRVATLVLLDGDTMTSPRFGGGASVQIARQLTFDLDVFARRDAESRAVVATLGAAFYSSYLGGGRRRVLNPFVGLRAGYGYLADQHAMAAGAELGLELYKHRYLHVETAVRALVFVHDKDATAGLHGALGVTIPF